jgi:hypothetical protein
MRVGRTIRRRGVRTLPPACGARVVARLVSARSREKWQPRQHRRSAGGGAGVRRTSTCLDAVPGPAAGTRARPRVPAPRAPTVAPAPPVSRARRPAGGTKRTSSAGRPPARTTAHLDAAATGQGDRHTPRRRYRRAAERRPTALRRRDRRRRRTPREPGLRRHAARERRLLGHPHPTRRRRTPREPSLRRHAARGRRLLGHPNPTRRRRTPRGRGWGAPG